MDFTRHNEQQAAVWQAFYAGTPTRVPVAIACNPRMILLDPLLNTRAISFRDCYENPDIMFDAELQFQHWYRHAVPSDIERGLPAQWTITPSFQNYYDAAWFGAEMRFPAGEVPATAPLLTDDNKRMLFDRGVPDPFAGLMGRARNYLDHFRTRAAAETFYDHPITVADSSPGLGCDGPFTVACNLRGTTEFCLDLYEDPEFAQELLAYIVTAVIARRRAWRAYFAQPAVRESVWFADDSIALLSSATYRELILPHHHTLVTTDAVPDAPLHVHLCGDATRHFPTLIRELHAVSFDTGFPVDHGKLRRELGPDILIYGGPHVDLLLHGTADDVVAETRRILRSGVMDGGKFILKEANNLAPRTPMRNLQAMYDTCREDGVYREGSVVR